MAAYPAVDSGGNRPFACLTVLLAAGLCVFSPYAPAGDEDYASSSPEASSGAAEGVHYQGRVTPLPELGGPEPPTKWNRWLPFYAQRVLDQGAALPNPYFVGYSYFNGDQLLQLGNLKLGMGSNALRSADFVQFQQSKIHSTSNQVQIGGWLFPFMNVYGIVGNVRGVGDMDITFSSLNELEKFTGIRTGCARRPNTPRCQAPIKLPTYKASYDGTTYGGGFTLVGQYKRLFFSLPVTYMVSDISMSESKVKSLNISPRVGMTVGLGEYGMLTPYVGATYFNVDAKITGQFDIPVPGGGNQTVPLKYSIDENVDQHWSGLAGLNWMPSKSVNILLEGGFGHSRQNLILTAFYRF